MVDVCQTQEGHEETVASVRAMLPQPQAQELAADILKALGDRTRFRIVTALMYRELCVCDLTQLLEMNQSAVSHQLRVLKNSRIVKYRKSGKSVFYSLEDSHIISIIASCIDHAEEMQS